MQTQFNIYLIIVGIGFIYGLVSFKKLTKPFKILVILIGYVFFAEVTVRYILPHFTKHIEPLYHLNVLVIIVLNAFIYFNLFQPNLRLKRVVIGLASFCGALALSNSFAYQGLYTFPSFGIAAQIFLSIALALLFFNLMLKTRNETPLLKQDVFWFNAGTLIFCSFTSVSFIFHNQLTDLNSYMLHYLNLVTNNFMYACFLVSLYLNQKSVHGR